MIDGLAVDGQIFGDRGGSPNNITLGQNESVTAIVFGYHTHRLGIMNLENFVDLNSRI